MNCPLCDAELDLHGCCPECGWTSEETEKRTETPERLPGIYYSALQETTAENDDIVKPVTLFGKLGHGISTLTQSLRERRARRDAEARKTLRLAAGLLGGTLLLFAVITCFYNPNATAVVGNGGISLSNAQFLVYYQSVYRAFLSSCQDENGNTQLPFNPGRKLTRQYYDLESGYSWQQYFMDCGLERAAVTQVLVTAAAEAQFTLPEEAQAQLEQELAQVDEDTVGQMFGAEVTAAGYRRYLQDSAIAQAYYASICADYHFSAEEIRAYYLENRDQYSRLSVSETPDVNLRHILFHPDSTDGAEWDEAERQARETLALCLAAEDPMAEFLRQVAQSQDAGSRDCGGLMENVCAGAIGGAFDSWCFDPAGHTAGEMTVVMSEYGWHVVCFESYCDSARWQQTVEADMRSAAAAKQIEALQAVADCRFTMFAEVP